MAADPRDPFPALWPPRPRLMATVEAIERVKKAIDDDNSGEGLRVKRKVLQRAEEAITKPPQDFPEFLLTARDTLRRLQSLGMAWLLEKNDVRYVECAKRELSRVCEGFPDWNPSHFLDTAEMTHAVAIGYDWFYDQLTDSERAMCVEAILQKGLRPGLAQLKGTPKPAWPTRTTNWNIVCNAGLMIGALAVADEKHELPREVFLRCLNSIPTGFHGYSPDGSWDEGPGYWAYATEYAAYLLSALRTALGREYGLAHLPGFSEGGLFRMHAEGSAAADGQAGKFFNFSDCDEEHRGSWCMRWLSLWFDKPMYNWVALEDGQTKPMDLLWFSADKPPGHGKGIPRNAFFRGNANVAMLRGNSDKRKFADGFRPWARQHSGDVYLGIRAGANRLENFHGQLDVGSFVLDAMQVRWATDIPPISAAGKYLGDYYLPGYFDVDQGRRFRYYRTNTIGHNTLVINGFNQPLGVQTEIVGFRESPDLVVVVVDLTAAYPDCLRVRRGFALIDGQHVLIVDELTPKQEMTVAWQMHTPATTSGGTLAQLTQKFKDEDGKEEDRNFFVQILEPQGAAFAVEEAGVTQPREAPNPCICKLVATLPKVVDPTRISVYLSASEGIARLPELLRGPLWSWLEWTGQRLRGYPL